MSFVSRLDRLHAKAVQSIMLRRFADFTRVVLAVGFFAPGLHKVMGIPFTTIPTDNPIGAFFDALYQTGFYYRFLGAAQVLAAVLVLFRRTSTLGALLFFSITSNVFVVTISIPFGTGTPIITGLMFLASLYLVCWDYDKLKPLLPLPASEVSEQPVASMKVDHVGNIAGKIGYWTFAVAGILLMCELRGLTPSGLGIRRGALAVTLFGGVIMASGYLIDVVKSFRKPFAERTPLA